MEQHGECHDKDRIKQLHPCKNCGSWDTARLHHAGTFAFPECWYWFCYECEKEWGGDL